jgi:hypothetical protein
VNGNTFTYVAWAWKAGGTASSNTDGSITSSVSVNSDYGFSIVSFTGDGSGTDTIGHGLNTTPKLIILKDRDNANDWLVYTKEIDDSWDYFKINKTDAKSDSSYSAATSSVFSYGTDAANYIAYCWSEISGFSKFSTYTGNGSSTGPVVTTGFKPKFILIKSTGTGHWMMIDTERNNYDWLFANLADAEASDTTDHAIDILDDGFQIKASFAAWNTNGQVYTYAAFAGTPAGEKDDSLIDTPTNYTAGSGNNGGNYAVLNPLGELYRSQYSGNAALTQGNLRLSMTSGEGGAMSTFPIPTAGKFYFEVTCTTKGSDQLIKLSGIDQVYGTDSDGLQLVFRTLSAGSIFGCTIDRGTGTVTKYIDNSSTGTATASAVPLFVRIYDYLGGDYTVNFGQRPFVYPQTGFSGLCTQDLPDPTIADGSTAMSATTWTGNGSTQTISGLNHSPDFIWHKIRSISGGSQLYDSVRGVSKRLRSDSTAAESTLNGVTAFNSDGWTMTAGNNNNETYVSWAWDGGTSTASNTDGSITSSVRANASAGISVVGFTGNGSAATIGHGLNAAPELILLKNRQTTQLWYVYSKELGAGKYLHLHKGDAAVSDVGMWNNVEPTSSVFTVGSYALSSNYIAYCFTPVEGFSAFGSYSGNGSSDGPFVFTGMRPRWLMVKSSSNSGEHWLILDTARDPYNLSDATIYANLDNAEAEAGALGIDILSNGFKPRGTNAGTNASGYTYIYAAFAEHPFKTARAR